LAACAEEPEPPLLEVSFDLTGAKAILFSQEDVVVDNTTSNIYKIDDQGNVSSVIENAKVVFARPFSEGVYVVVDDPSQDALRNFYVRLDNTFIELQENVGNFKGENDNGDLVFTDVSVFRKSTLKIEKMQTTLDMPTIQSLSGNLAIIRDNSTFQIYNTVNGIRYNIAGCNGPRMVAFNNDKALLDDCSNKMLFDMTTGERAAGEINSWNQEAVRVGDNIAVLTQGLGTGTGYYLGLVDQTGAVTVLSDHEFNIGTSACMNCGDANTVLFNSGDYFVVKELNKVTVVKIGDTTPKTILSGYNITSITLSDDLVYFVAEDNTGKPITGTYDLITEENTILLNDVVFDKIQTFN
jgi:hypothetical protein